MTVKERIAALRARMKETGIDAYLIPTDDFHGSEYVGEYFKCRKYITGFTGSAGTAVIMQDMAGLWTDGRYFIQAADQLEGTGITLFKMGEPEVPTVHEFLKKNLTQGRCLGFDGRTVSAKEAAELEKMLDENGVSLSVDHDLAGAIWENRPVLSCEPVTELDIKWAGESRADKCARIRKAMEKKGADLFVLTSLDDIAWLLNIRGGDIHCCPVVLSYLVMTKTEIRLFANEKAFQTDVLEALGVKITVSPEKSAELLHKINICFLFAQNYHIAMKYVAPIRKELGIRTVFNILGPLSNPAGANMELMGVYDQSLVEPLAQVMANLGVNRGMVVYGQDSLDEISMCAPTSVCEIRDGKFTSYEITPEQFGYERCEKGALTGGTPAENAEITKAILKGEEKGPKRQAVCLNAGAALYIAGKAASIEEGVKLAESLIDSGAALKKLGEFVEETNK